MRRRSPSLSTGKGAPPIEEPDAPTDSSGSPWPTGHRFADRTRANHAAVHALLATGHSRRAIQRQLGMTYRAVKLLADATAPEDLFQREEGKGAG